MGELAVAKVVIAKIVTSERLSFFILFP